MGLESYLDNAYLIPLFPLIAAAVAGFFGARWLKGQSHWPIWIGVGLSALMSIGILVHMVNHVHALEGRATFGESRHWFDWISIGGFNAEAGAWFDPLTAVMLTVVCGIGFLICVFAAGYMKGEAGYFRFFSFLGLFIFAMTSLVMGNNFILLYLGWEGVGLCSYLLIGYYYDRPSAREAAKKAFLVNRVGDLGFGIGIMLIFLVFGTVSFFGTPGAPGALALVTDHAFVGALPQWKQDLIPWIPFCLMVGAFGKSAQFPLYVWLPDAMEGPTPVSALIHAATMVTAGVYMIARCGTLFVASTASLTVVAIVGAFTAIFAATIALRQFDLKKVFAYSTVSQLGFMFVGVGVLAPVAGVFHLVTHAFFKALLFLSSGVVMHAMMGELDLRKMSGLKTVLPKTRWLMLIGCLALAGFPFFSGFFSKDEIVAAAWEKSKLLGFVLLLTAFLTAYYTFRLYFRVFEGPTVIPPAPAGGHGHGAADDHGHAAAAPATDYAHGGHGGHAHHNHEPAVMILPLVVLAVGAVLAGMLLYSNHNLGHFLGRSPSLSQTFRFAERDRHHELGEVNPVPLGQEDHREMETVEAEQVAHRYMMIVSGLIAVSGIGAAYVMHLKNRRAAEDFADRHPALVRTLEAKYWVDEIYQAGIVEPLRALGQLFFAVDRVVVDGLVWAVSFVPQLSGLTLKLTTQTGNLQGYAAAMLFGILIILLLIFM